MKSIWVFSNCIFEKNNLQFWIALQDEYDSKYNLSFFTPENTNKETLLKNVQFSIWSYALLANQKKLDKVFFEELLFVNSWRCEKKSEKTLIREFSIIFYLINNFKPKLILIWNDTSTFGLIVKRVAEEAKIPFLIIERTPLPKLFSVDRLGVLKKSEYYEESMKNNYSAYCERKYMEKVLNYSNLIQGGSTWWEQPSQNNPDFIKKLFRVPSDKMVIFFPGQVATDIQNVMYNKNYHDSADVLQWLCSNLDSEKYFVLGKHHPKDTCEIESYQKIIKGFGEWTDKINVKDCLGAADFVCGVNSAVLFEAILCKLPVYSFGESIFDGHDIFYHNRGRSDIDSLNLFLDRSRDSVECRYEKSLNVIGNLMGKDLVYVNTNEVNIFPRKIDFLFEELLRANVCCSNTYNHLFLQYHPLVFIYKFGQAFKKWFFIFKMLVLKCLK